MNGRLSQDTAERLLRGERVGPPGLADLLAAAAATPARDDPDAEEAAVAAFRDARPRVSTPRPRARRSRLLTVKAALLALVLAGAGGVTVAAVAAHRTDTSGPRQVPAIHESVTSQTTGTRGATATPGGQVTPSTGPRGVPGQKLGHAKQKSHPVKKPKPVDKHKGPSPKGKWHA